VAHRRDTSIPQALLQPFPAQLMTAYPISTKINSVKNDTPAVIEPASLRSANEIKPALIPRGTPDCLVLNCTPAQSAVADELRAFPIGHRETPPHKRKEIAYLERLGDRSCRTQFARHPQEVGLECLTAPGHRNDGRARRELTKVSYRLHALFLGHEDIAENKVEGLFLELSNTVFAVHGYGNVITVRL
jgi:hypothetical protein